MDPSGKILFGYFFGPFLNSPDEATLNGLKPEQAVLRLRFGALGLRNGKWPIVGTIPHWIRSVWPMPDFARRPPDLKPVRVHYADDDPSHVEREAPVDDDLGLATDSLSGYGAVEVKLGKLLQKAQT
jgi:hypothetical protein